MTTHTLSPHEFVSVDLAITLFLEDMHIHPELALSAHYAASKRYGQSWTDKLRRDAPAAYVQFLHNLNARYNQVCEPPQHIVLSEYLMFHERILKQGTLAILQQVSTPVPKKLMPSMSHNGAHAPMLFDVKLIKTTDISYAQAPVIAHLPTAYFARWMKLDISNKKQRRHLTILSGLWYATVISTLLYFHMPKTWDWTIAFLITTMPAWMILEFELDFTAPALADVQCRTSRLRLGAAQWPQLQAEWSDLTAYFLGTISLYHLQSDAGLKFNWLSIPPAAIPTYHEFLQSRDYDHAYTSFCETLPQPVLN